MNAFDIIVEYDSSILDAQESTAQIGSFMTNNGGTYFSVTNTIDEAAGIIQVSGLVIGGCASGFNQGCIIPGRDQSHRHLAPIDPHHEVTGGVVPGKNLTGRNGIIAGGENHGRLEQRGTAGSEPHGLRSILMIRLVFLWRFAGLALHLKPSIHRSVPGS